MFKVRDKVNYKKYKGCIVLMVLEGGRITIGIPKEYNVGWELYWLNLKREYGDRYRGRNVDNNEVTKHGPIWLEQLTTK